MDAYTKAKEKLFAISVAETFKSNALNHLLVMCNHMQRAIENSDDTEVNEEIIKDYIKYVNILLKKLGK